MHGGFENGKYGFFSGKVLRFHPIWPIICNICNKYNVKTSYIVYKPTQ